MPERTGRTPESIIEGGGNPLFNRAWLLGELQGLCQQAVEEFHYDSQQPALDFVAAASTLDEHLIDRLAITEGALLTYNRECEACSGRGSYGPEEVRCEECRGSGVDPAVAPTNPKGPE